MMWHTQRVKRDHYAASSDAATLVAVLVGAKDGVTWNEGVREAGWTCTSDRHSGEAEYGDLRQCQRHRWSLAVRNARRAGYVISNQTLPEKRHIYCFDFAGSLDAARHRMDMMTRTRIPMMRNDRIVWQQIALNSGLPPRIRRKAGDQADVIKADIIRQNEIREGLGLKLVNVPDVPPMQKALA
jgi:hypothetical protein